jgi:hypothetical protein
MAPGQPSPLLLCAQRNLTATAEVCLRYGVPVRAPYIHWVKPCLCLVTLFSSARLDDVYFVE